MSIAALAFGLLVCVTNAASFVAGEPKQLNGRTVSADERALGFVGRQVWKRCFLHFRSARQATFHCLQEGQTVQFHATKRTRGFQAVQSRRRSYFPNVERLCLGT